MFRVAAIILAVASFAHAAPARRVFGYLYTGSSTANLRWDLVTDLAFFSQAMGTDGTLPTTAWKNQGKAMIDAAHQHEVRVKLVVTLFNSSGGSEIATFLGNPAAVQKGTQAIVDAVVAEGGDGVDLDFEFVPKASKAQFVSFVQDLGTALHAALPAAELSLAMPGANYPGYDIAQLGAAADLLMIMAYDFHYAGSDPGPVAPLADSTLWKAGSSTSAVTLFTASAPASKLLLGIPLYGYNYHATSNAVPTTHVAGTTASAVQWKDCPQLAQMYGRIWDAASSTPYLVYQESGGAWRQLFYEDKESLGHKIDLAEASDLAGIGLWNLAYADDDFWGVVDTKWSVVPDMAAPPDMAMAPDLSMLPQPTPTPEPEDAGVDFGHGTPPQGGCDILPHPTAGPLGLLCLLLAGPARSWSRRRSRPDGRAFFRRPAR